jgi:hypothetical protein
VTAVEDHAAAQLATLAAKDELGVLDTLIAAGDHGVTGADHMAAKAEVTVAEGREAGAFSRMQAEIQAAEEVRKAEAVDRLMDGYSADRSAVSDAFEKRLQDDMEIKRAVETLQSNTRNNLLAAGLTSNSVPGHGHLQTLDLTSVFAALQVLTESNAGLVSSLPYPRQAIQPIESFLPVGVSTS